MEENLQFVAVEFPNDNNVKGLTYWYLCDFSAVEGMAVNAPLGRHNRVQTGVVRRVRICPAYEAPFPLHLIKRVIKIEE